LYVQPNVLIDDPPRARLTDFGTTFSGTTSGDGKGTTEWERMDHAFLAPELVTYNPQNPGFTYPSVETDTYAFALLVWHVYTNRVPIASEYPDKRILIRKLVQRGVRPTRPTDMEIPDLLWDNMVIGWSQDPTARPTVTQWLKTLHEIEPEKQPRRWPGIMQQITSPVSSCFGNRV
jgi:hypothetical protein